MYSTVRFAVSAIQPMIGFLRRLGSRADVAIQPARQSPVSTCIVPTSRIRTGRLPAAMSIDARPGKSTRRPVRVVRVVESGQPARQCGRLVITGRMADVCAELDRMVEREAMAGIPS
jgi:hypothetical protein